MINILVFILMLFSLTLYIFINWSAKNLHNMISKHLLATWSPSFALSSTSSSIYFYSFLVILLVNKQFNSPDFVNFEQLEYLDILLSLCYECYNASFLFYLCSIYLRLLLCRYLRRIDDDQTFFIILFLTGFIYYKQLNNLNLLDII
jgi:hypothetical protein